VNYFSFKAQIENHNLGLYQYRVIFLSPKIVKQLPFEQYPRLRIEGEVSGEPFVGAWQPARGRWYLMLSKRLLKTIRAEVGDTVSVEFRLSGQDEVQVPVELLNAIRNVDVLWLRWQKLTAGAKRTLSYMVLNAKTVPTKLKRIEKVLEFLNEGHTSVSVLMKPQKKIKTKSRNRNYIK
jgi:hypothetical protein